MPPLHVIIPTHTTRHLRWALLGVARQSRRPDTVTVTCDNDDPAIRDLVGQCAAEFELPIRIVQRPHQGVERLAQVRNNAVRALLDREGARSGRLVFVDGDCFLAADVLERHEQLGGRGDLVIGYRINLTQEQTEGFDEAAAAAGRPPVEPTPEQLRGLQRRHSRYQRQLLLRRFGLTKPHKPKPLGGHHSVSLDRYREVNGHDERYHTWGTEDDDFGRRVYLVGGVPVVAVRDLMVLHLYHPSRQGGPWGDRENARRFRTGGPARCIHGVENPMPQPPVTVTEFPGKPAAAGAGAGQ